jgi:hypothetical protein
MKNRSTGSTAQSEVIENSRLEALRGLSLSNPYYREELERFGVRRIDLDIVPQGADIPPDSWGFGVGCHWPWACVSNARGCLTRRAMAAGEEKIDPGAICSKPCRRFNTSAIASEYSDRLLQRGNTVFMLHGDYAHPYLAGELPVDRIVLQPYVPL